MDLTKVAISEADAREAVRRIDSPETNGILDAVTSGKPIIHLKNVMREAGVDRERLPELAVAHIDWEQVEFMADDEDWNFSSSSNYRNSIIFSSSGMPSVTLNQLVADVPRVPRYIDTNDKQSLYILWEAQWREKPIEDPFLVRRIGDSLLFVIEAQWDLTEVEKLLLE